MSNADEANLLTSEVVLIQPAVLRSAVRRGTPRYLLLGAGTLAVMFAALAFGMPQTFSAKTSLTVQQPGAATGGMASMLTASLANKRYIGVLKSRRIASVACRASNLRSVLGMKSEQEALEKFTESLQVDDNATDGLLYVTVNLPGPPLLAPGRSARSQAVASAAAAAANSCADGLVVYYATSDNDQSLVMLRTAEQQLAAARTSYQQAITRLSNEMVALPPDADSAGRTPTRLGTGDDSAQPSGPTELATLYMNKGQNEIELRAMETRIKQRRSLLQQQFGALTTLPLEDPLLTAAREQVARATVDLDELRIQLGETNPRVVAAKERLAQARARLRAQSKTMQKGLTTEDVDLALQRDVLATKGEQLDKQIAKSQRRHLRGQRMTASMTRLANDVALKLEVLKATATQAAVTRMQMAAAANRIAVVDRALPPTRSAPGLIRICIYSVIVAFFAIGAAVLLDYRHAVARAATATVRA